MQIFLGARFGKTEIFWALPISIFIISEIFKVQWAKKSKWRLEISVSFSESLFKFSKFLFKIQNLCFYISGSGSLFLDFKFSVVVFESLFFGYKISVILRNYVFRLWNLFFCQNTPQNLCFGCVKDCAHCCLNSFFIRTS